MPTIPILITFLVCSSTRRAPLASPDIHHKHSPSHYYNQFTLLMLILILSSSLSLIPLPTITNPYYHCIYAQKYILSSVCVFNVLAMGWWQLTVTSINKTCTSCFRYYSCSQFCFWRFFIKEENQKANAVCLVLWCATISKRNITKIPSKYEVDYCCNCVRTKNILF